MDTKLDKRSYLKTLRTQFYDKNNFNLITKLIGTSIKDSYNFNLNKKDKEFILNTMKSIYDNKKNSIDKNINLEENLSILNKNLLNMALKELNTYYNEKKESINSKHKLIERPVSTAKQDNSINNDFEQLLIKRNNNEKREEINFLDEKHHKPNNNQNLDNIGSNETEFSSLDEQFNDTKLSKDDTKLNKYYDNEKINVEDKFKEAMNNRNNIIEPLNKPDSKTIEQEIKDEIKLETIKEENLENEINIEVKNTAPEMPENIIENTNNYSKIDIKENIIIEDMNLNNENKDVTESKKDNSELMNELYSQDYENDDYMEVNDLLQMKTTKIDENIEPNETSVLEYTKIHEELREKNKVDQEYITNQLKEIEKNIINTSSNNNQNNILTNDIDNKLEKLVNIQENLFNNLSLLKNDDKFNEQFTENLNMNTKINENILTLNDNLKDLNTNVVQKISFINNTINSKIEDNEIYQHKVTQNLENQLNNTRNMYDNLSNLLNVQFDKINDKLQSYNNELKEDNYKLLTNTFKLNYNLLNDFNLNFKTKNNSKKINFDFKFLELPKNIITQNLNNQIVKLEFNLLNIENTLLDSNIVFSKLILNNDKYLFENLYQDIFSFENKNKLNEFILNIKIKNIYDDLIDLDYDYFNLQSISPINLDQDLNKIKISEVNPNTIIKKASLLLFDKPHNINKNNTIYFKNFSITPIESQNKLLSINNILKINDEKSVIIDLDTRNFNFDTLGKLYCNNLKGALCLDIKEFY
jgi:hypothetical protein